VEEIDGRPEEIVEVRFEAGVFERRDQGVEDLGDGACDEATLKKWPGIGLIREGGSSRGAAALAERGGEEMSCGLARGRCDWPCDVSSIRISLPS